MKSESFFFFLNPPRGLLNPVGCISLFNMKCRKSKQRFSYPSDDQQFKNGFAIFKSAPDLSYSISLDVAQRESH